MSECVRDGAVVTAEKELGCMWVGASNSVYSICIVSVYNISVYMLLCVHKEVFMFGSIHVRTVGH